MAACRMALLSVSVLILARFGSSVRVIDTEGYNGLQAEQLAKVWLQAPSRSGLPEGTRGAWGTLSLLQTGATLVKPRPTNLDRTSGQVNGLFWVDALSKETDKSFYSFEREADSLRADVNNFHEGMQESFSEMQSKCKQDLETQHESNMNLAQANAYSAEAMKSMAREIRHLQRSAEKLQDDVIAAEDEMHKLAENITTGRLFIDRSLMESQQRVQAGTELKALAELDKKFNAATAAREKKQARHRSKRTKSAHGPLTSLLQLNGGDIPDGLAGHEEIMSELVDKLVKLNEQGKEEQESLLSLCRTGIEHGVVQHRVLDKEQAMIKERMQLRSDLKDRFNVALEHLTANLKQVQQRRHSLAQFAKVVGDRALEPGQKSGALMMSTQKGDGAH